MLSCRIAMLRKRAGISQSQLAQQLHICPSTIGMYEQGRRTPNVDILIQMSKLFNVSLNYLVTGSEFIPTYEKKAENPTLPTCPCCRCNHKQLSDRLR